MFLGEFTHTIDDKKRLTLPKKFQKQLGKKVVLTRGLDNCLFLFPKDKWEQIAGKLNELPFTNASSRGFARFMFSGSAEVEVDKSGRILIPENLRNFANLGQKVVLAGVSDRVEIWDEKKWQQYTSKIEKEGEKLAENLEGIF